MSSNDTDRIIGALQEHKEATDNRLSAIESKLDRLTKFESKALGVIIGVTSLIGLLGQLVFASIRH